VDHNLDSIDCENDSFDGGWTKIFTYLGEEVTGDNGIVYGTLPLWYNNAQATFDQYLWIDSETKFDLDTDSDPDYK
jgi:sensor domain CHASE-containing protein